MILEIAQGIFVVVFERFAETLDRAIRLWSDKPVLGENTIKFILGKNF
jgi:hypothetical protein